MILKDYGKEYTKKQKRKRGPINDTNRKRKFNS